MMFQDNQTITIKSIFHTKKFKGYLGQPLNLFLSKSPFLFKPNKINKKIKNSIYLSSNDDMFYFRTFNSLKTGF